MLNFSKLKESRSQDGEWLDYEKGVRLLIAPMGNKKFDKIVTKLVSKKKRRLRNSDPSSEQMLEITQHAVSEAILLGWEGIGNDEGQPITYTPGLGREAFEANYDFYKDVIEMANGLKRGMDKDDEDAEGN